MSIQCIGWLQIWIIRASERQSATKETMFFLWNQLSVFNCLASNINLVYYLSGCLHTCQQIPRFTNAFYECENTSCIFDAQNMNNACNGMMALCHIRRSDVVSNFLHVCKLGRIHIRIHHADIYFQHYQIARCLQLQLYKKHKQHNLIIQSIMQYYCYLRKIYWGEDMKRKTHVLYILETIYFMYSIVRRLVNYRCFRRMCLYKLLRRCEACGQWLHWNDGALPHSKRWCWLRPTERA